MKKATSKFLLIILFVYLYNHHCPLCLSNIFFVIIRRTLKIYLALARGIPVVTDKFVYASLCSGYWASVEQLRHPLYKHHTLGERLQCMEGKTFCVIRSSFPSIRSMQTLIREVGGRIMIIEDILTGKCKEFVDYYVVGNKKDLKDWLRTVLIKEKEKEKEKEKGDAEKQDKIYEWLLSVFADKKKQKNDKKDMDKELSQRKSFMVTNKVSLIHMYINIIYAIHCMICFLLFLK
jgi:hypothetical protein